jgi:hypothetical protein
LVSSGIASLGWIDGSLIFALMRGALIPIN